ncbi:CD48 antigen-like [Leptodactylus fuscus]|uniref:CD48 antigen-like n=1 Tax=Leptodactylus fuscus TaxID=238119 RepID=UPI003F4E8F3B
MVAAAELLSLLLTILVPGGLAGAWSVVGLLNRSVEFYNPDLSLPVVEVAWNFITQNKTTKVVMYYKDQVSIYNPQFNDRLEVFNTGTKLLIKNLKMEDMGVYTASMTLTSSEVHEVKYSLTVYEPIPSIEVRKGNTTDQCNMTLYCSVPSNTSNLSYHWKYRHRDSEYQPFNNESSTQISVPPDHQDTEFLCIVHSPADQKNASISITSCFSIGHPRLWYVLSIVPLCIVLMAAIWMTWKIRRRKAVKEEEVEYHVTEEPTASSSQSLPYDQLPNRSHPPYQKFNTLYTSLATKT